jgi:hypothetical protein
MSPWGYFSWICLSDYNLGNDRFVQGILGIVFYVYSVVITS